MTQPYDDTDNSFVLEAHDALTETVKRTKEKFDSGDMRIRNLMFLRQDYIDDLQKSLEAEKFQKPGIPIWITTDDLRLDRIRLMTKVYPRSFFTERANGGTEIIYTSSHRGGAGFQWYVMSWQVVKGRVHVWASHWMIIRDTENKRQTLWFTRGFNFKEKKVDELDEIGIRKMMTNWVRMADVPSKHYRTSTGQALKHSLRHETNLDEWTTVTSKYGMFEIMFTLQAALREYDMGEHKAWYLHQHFKHYWNIRVLNAVWGDMWKSSKKFDTDGILKDLWYVPELSSSYDKEQFEHKRKDWEAVRARYNTWLGEFVNPPHLVAPTEEEMDNISENEDT